VVGVARRCSLREDNDLRLLQINLVCGRVKHIDNAFIEY